MRLTIIYVLIFLIIICIAIMATCICLLIKYRRQNQNISLDDKLEPIKPKIIKFAKNSLDNMISNSMLFDDIRDLEQQLTADILDEMVREMDPDVVELVKDMDEEDLNSFILYTIRHEWSLSSRKSRLISANKSFNNHSETESDEPPKNTNIEKSDITSELLNIINRE